MSARKWHDGVVRVLVGDDSPLFRRRALLALEAEDDIEVVAEAPDADVARTAVRQHAPDVALIGAHLPPLDGIRTAATLRESSPGLGLALVVGSLHDDAARDRTAATTQVGGRDRAHPGAAEHEPTERVEVELRRALHVGVGAVVARDAEPQRLADIVRTLARRRPVLDAALARALGADYAHLSERGDRAAHEPPAPSLDPLERRVLEALAAGNDTDGAAAELSVGPATVENLAANALEKLQRWTASAVRARRAELRSATP